MTEESGISDETRRYARTYSQRCGVKYIESEEEASNLSERKNSIYLLPKPNNRISIIYFDKDGQSTEVREGAEVTIKRTLEDMFAGCQIHDDYFSKRCRQLGGKVAHTSQFGYENFNDQMCVFLEEEDKPPSNMPYYDINYRDPNYDRYSRYHRNDQNIVRMDVAIGNYGKPSNFYAWIYDQGRGYGDWEPIRTDEGTFKEWFNNRSWDVKRDDAWVESLPEEEQYSLRDGDYEVKAKRTKISEKGDDFETIHSRQADIISFFSKDGSRFHRWKNATPRDLKAKVLLNDLEMKIEELSQEEGNEELAEFLGNVRSTIGWDLAPEIGYGVPYDPEKMREKYMEVSPYPEFRETNEKVQDYWDDVKELDDPKFKEYFADRFDWMAFETAKNILDHLNKKIQADAHYTKDIPHMKEDLEIASNILDEFRDEIEVIREDEALVDEFEEWYESQEQAEQES